MDSAEAETPEEVAPRERGRPARMHCRSEPLRNPAM